MTRSSALRSDLVDLSETAAVTESVSGDPTARPAIVGIEFVGYEEITPIWRQCEKRWIVGLRGKSLLPELSIPKRIGIDPLTVPVRRVPTRSVSPLTSASPWCTVKAAAAEPKRKLRREIWIKMVLLER